MENSFLTLSASACGSSAVQRITMSTGISRNFPISVSSQRTTIAPCSASGPRATSTSAALPRIMCTPSSSTRP